MKINEEQFKLKYAEDILNLKNLVEEYNNLQEQDIASSYQIMKKSLIAFYRWTKIQHDVNKCLSRGECSYIKKNIENYMTILTWIHNDSKTVYKNGRDDRRSKTDI